MSWFALVALTVAAYANAVQSPFQFDDRPLAETLATGALPTVGGLRPIVKATYVASALVSAAPWSFHVGNVVLHLVNVALVVWLLRRKGFGALSTWASAALFALHPIHTEAVTYVSGRSAALTTSFVVLALLVRAHGRRAGRPVAGELASLALVALAVLTKEASAVVPVAFVAWDLIVERRRLGEVWRPHAAWAAFGLGVFAFFLGHPSYFTLLYEAVGQRTPRDAVVHALAAIAYMGKRLVLWARPCIDPGLWAPPERSAVLAGGGIVAVAATAAVTQARRHPHLSFGAFWFLLHGFLPYVLVSRTDVLNERHLYVANVGLVLCVAAGWEGLAQEAGARWAASAAVAVAAVLFAQTVRRNAEYATEVSLWESTTRDAPHNPRAFYNLGTAYERAGRTPPAVRAYMKALALEPRFAEPRERLVLLHRNATEPDVGPR
jgi:tetratricopeptide (TPR) repeat protein